MELVLDWSQSYMGLKYHMEEALEEKNMNILDATSKPPYAIFSHKYFEEMQSLNNDKIYDYCFIGSIDTEPEKRAWAVDFARKNFTSQSIFINTDGKLDWEPLGEFDKTNQVDGVFCPKKHPDNQSKQAQYRIIKENLFYFQTMANSKYVLCPAGDTAWSFRFYEVLMCKSLPIVITWHHTYRTLEESEIKYSYMLKDNIREINSEEYKSLIDNNTNIFRLRHLL